MVQVRAGENDARDAHRGGRADASEPGLRVPRSIGAQATPPCPAHRVIRPRPHSTRNAHVAAVRAIAMLAATFCAAEADEGRQLVLVNPVKPAMFARDRHDDPMSQPKVERTKNGCGFRFVITVKLLSY